MTDPHTPETAVHHGFDTGIWLDGSLRPREYAGLDWVNARSLLHPLVELGQVKPTDIVADIGTGTGAVLNYVAPYAGFAVGIDVARPMLAQAQRPGSNTALVEADARGAIPLLDESFDVVTSRMMLHDLEDPAAAIDQAWRLVKPGGSLVLAEFVTDNADVQAVVETDAFEAGTRLSSLIDPVHFKSPSQESVDLLRRIFALKHEPDRHLWTGRDFLRVVAEAVGPAAEVRLNSSMTPFNSVANWLGRSGFGLPVKQTGILLYLSADSKIQEEIGLKVTRNGEIVPPEDYDSLIASYFNADETKREAMDIDVKVHRAFANVVAVKAR